MADIEPPSFSLGIDFDFDKPSELDPPIGNKQIENENEKEKEKQKEEEFQFRVSDSDPDSPPPKLRRLRRGYGPSISKPISRPMEEFHPLPTSNVGLDDDNDDDIEEFSSEELVRTDDLPAPQHHSVFSSSKIPLSGYGILKNQQENKVHNRKRKQDSNCPPSTSLGASSKEKSVLLDLTASPIRRFRLLDSDSDFEDPPEDVHLDRGSSGVGCSKQNRQKESIQNCHQITRDRQTVLSSPISQKQDIWNDFHAEKRCAVPTPAFDEIFKDYYATKQNSGVPDSAFNLCSSGQGKSNNKKSMQHQDVESADPPSLRYFFHNDSRIQGLVRSRLRYFCPLISLSDVGNNPCNGSAIDYMSQFGHGDSTKKQPGRQANAPKSSRSAVKKTKNSNAGNTSHASGEWINPKQTNNPKDAGRRRVRAESGSAGHWFTSEDGKKVYVSSTGKELTGQLAYRQYRKESGQGAKGYKKSKKKSVSKKK